MKKLLSLLSVLTISGSAVPTTIAASPYKKERTMKNSNINYQQKNNIKRTKRNTEIIDNIYFVDENGGVRKETDVPYPITTMFVFKDPDSGQRKYGDIYFGTINGVYLRKAGASTTTKIDGINESIKLINSYANNGQVHVINNKGEVYFVDENGGVRKETDVPYPITTMFVFKDPDSGQRKYGDVYFGTTNGVYLRKAGASTTTKIDGINQPVDKIIISSNRNSVYFILNSFTTKIDGINQPIKKIIRTQKYEIFITINNDLYYKKESGEIKKHNLFGLVEGKVWKIKKDSNNNFYILLNNNQLWKSDYNFSSIENGSITSITNDDNQIKDFIIDKFNNIFILTEKNNVYYKKQNDNNFNKLNIFVKNEQINNILYSKEEWINFLTDNSSILINNNQIDYLTKNNNCEIQYPLIRRPRTNNINYNDIFRSNVVLNMQDPINFRKNIEQIRIFLFNNRIVRQLEYGPHQFYQLNAAESHIHRYFSIPVQLENQTIIELVYNSSNLYLQGFINEQNGVRHYYHFRSNSRLQVLERIDGLNNNNHDLGYSGDYTTIVLNENSMFNSDSIINAFTELSTLTNNTGVFDNIKNMIFYVILTTSEALRFFPVATELENMFRDTEIQHNYAYFRPAINSWSHLTRISRDNNPGTGRVYLEQAWQDFWWAPGAGIMNQENPTPPLGTNILWDYYNIVLVAVVGYGINVACHI